MICPICGSSHASVQFVLDKNKNDPEERRPDRAHEQHRRRLYRRFYVWNVESFMEEIKRYRKSNGNPRESGRVPESWK